MDWIERVEEIAIELRYAAADAEQAPASSVAAAETLAAATLLLEKLVAKIKQEHSQRG